MPSISIHGIFGAAPGCQVRRPPSPCCSTQHRPDGVATRDTTRPAAGRGGAARSAVASDSVLDFPPFVYPRHMPGEGSRYKRLRTIASGGMGTVWLGRMEGASGFE